MYSGIEIYGQGDDNLKKTPEIAGALAERLELPGEAVGELKLSAVGRRRALIENHRGPLSCTEERIAVRGGRGSLSISGVGLCIKAMNEKVLLISGKLERAEWDG